MSETRFGSRSTAGVLGVAGLVSLGLWFLLGSSVASAVTLSFLTRVGMALSIGGVSLILALLVKHMDVSRECELFVSVTALYGIVQMFAWMGGFVRFAVSATVLGLALVMVCYVGIMEEAVLEA